MELNRELRLKPWWLALGWLMVGCLLYLTLTPHPPQPMDFRFADKIEHAAGFAWLALWFFQIVAVDMKRRTGLALVGLGIGIEIAQSFTPTRSFEYADMLADGVGVIAGAWLVRGWPGNMLFVVEKWLLQEARKT